MSIELIAILVLLLMFILGSVLPINLGVIGFVASFVVGSLISGLKMKDIFSAFPADLFVTIAGVTYLFAIVQNNGTVNLITKGGLRLVRGNIGMIPWVMFALSTILTSVGTLGAACVAVVAPIALRFAAQYNISPLLMGVLVVNGSVAGYYSPLNPTGLIINASMEKLHVVYSPLMLYINGLIFAFVVSVIVYIACGGLRLFKNSTAMKEVQAAQLEVSAATADPTAVRDDQLTWYRGFTLVGLILLVVLALAYKVNIGFAAFMVALVLAIMAPKQQAGVVSKMPWSVILMISGIVTYVGVLDKIGGVEYLTELITSVDNSHVASLVASYVAGVGSSFAATSGFLAAIIPLAASILQDPSLSAIAVISAIAISAGIVDLSPFSANGSLLLANAQGIEEKVYFKQILIISGLFIGIGPGLAWLIFVLIGG